MQHDTADHHATSHAGQFDGFEVFWADKGSWREPDRRGVIVDSVAGWYIGVPNHESDELFGPYATSQAAFGAVKDCIDKMISRRTA